jgi:Fe-S cluster biosynthesis and repair protein YggX
MSDEFTCVQCGAKVGETCEKTGETVEPMVPPVANKYWAAVQSKVCAPRWADWKDMEVKVINELRLNLLEREHRTMLKQHMIDFLALEGKKEGAVPDAVAANWKPPE